MTLTKHFLMIIGLFLLPVFSFAQTTTAGKDTVTTKSGLKYIILAKGNGEKAAAGKEVAVNYDLLLRTHQLYRFRNYLDLVE